MTRYLRPLAILSGMAAVRAIDGGHALPLAGGPLAFALVEIVERGASGQIERRIAPAPELAEALAVHTAPRAAFAGLPLDPPLVMGVVNATPNSFSDGGKFLDPGKAIAHAEAMIEAGARIVDIGGESTRPGATKLESAEEIRRILPIVQGMRALANAAGVVVSIDTRNAATMRAALEAGAGMINDVSALTHDAQALVTAAAACVPVVLMHMRGEPGTMQHAPAYEDVALDVYDALADRIAACEAAGIARTAIAIDPGIGFGKNAQHNLALLDQLALFHGLGVPLLIGVSRKSFIGRLSADAPPDRRLGGSLAAGFAAIGQGAQMLRVHDVAETVQAVRILDATRRT